MSRFRQEFGDEIAEAIAESFEGDLGVSDTLMNQIENDDDESDDVENDDDDVHLNIEKVIFFQIQ